jgi:hypothetical protein
MLHIDGGVDDESSKREQETQGDEGESPSGPVTAEGEDQQHRGTGHIGRHGVEIGLDGAVSETLDDDWKEELDSLEWHTETDLDGQDGPAGPVLEDSESVPDIEFLVYDGRTVNLEAEVGKLLLRWCQEAGFRG